MTYLKGKAVVVTGAGQGLGRAYALDIVANGGAVVVNDVDAVRADAVVTEITGAGGRAVASHDSVATWQGASAIVDVCVNAFGSIDGVVNNAGIMHRYPAIELDEARIRKTVEVNLLGTFYVGVQALKRMAGQGSGSIVNITSSSQMGSPHTSVYGATKGAISTLTYSWACEFKGTGIRINAFSPKAWTRMMELSPDPRAQQSPPPEDNAPVVSYLLSDAAAGISGQVIQRRGAAFVIVAHPQITDFEASHHGWDVATVVEHFDPILRKHQQHVGWPPPDGWPTP
jgi:NAD(P)-dependent dehydrogenase (short-subunit alcohol dehydrogenase family)